VFLSAIENPFRVYGSPVYQARPAPTIRRAGQVLLGHDQSSFEELENSVQGITQRLNTWDTGNESRLVKKLEGDLSKLRGKEARIEADLCSIRETETYKHPPMNGGYSGTLQSIASRIRNEEGLFGWIEGLTPDNVELPETPPLSNTEACELLSSLQALDPDRQDDLQKPFPAIEAIRSPEEIEALIAAEKETQKAWDDHRGIFGDACPLSGETEILEDFLQSVESCLSRNSEIKNRVFPFAQKLALDVRCGQEDSWRTLKSQTQSCLTAIGQYPDYIAGIRVAGHDDVDLVLLREDARALLEHIENGGTLKRWLRYVSQVKGRRYIIEKVQVGGKKATTLETLRILAAWADIQYNLVRLRDLWKGVAEISNGDLSQQLAIYRDFCRCLETAEDLYRSIKRASELLSRIGGLGSVSWRVLSEIEEARNKTRNELLRRRADEHSQQLRQQEGVLYRQLPPTGRHPVAEQLAEAIRSRSHSAYAAAYGELRALWIDREKLDQLNSLLAKLQETAPALADALRQSRDLHLWQGRLVLLPP
jgi:hypothetical protein